MNKKIGLVIQGAILSIGRAGNNLHASPGQLKKNDGMVHFDSRENIQKIIDDFGHLFDEIVVSVFDNQLKPGDNWPGAKIVSMPDPGGIKQEGHYKDNNKFRQFISTLNGLNELEKSGVEYAVKIRTDQYLDVGKLVESFFEEIEKHPNKNSIGVTVMHPPTFLLHDLYFASNLKSMKKFCEAILAYDKFEFIDSVHREMVLKHAFVEYKDRIGVPEYAYFPISPPSGVCLETRKIFSYMFEHAYFDLDPEVFRGTIWRGTHYERDHVERLVEKRDPSRFRYNLFPLISIDWHRYFAFRKEAHNTRVGVMDKTKAQIGRLGWLLWNLARKAVRMVR